MATQRQQLKTLAPQPTVGATPVRISSTDLFVRVVIIESAEGNAGQVYVADTELKATSSNRHVLYNEGDTITIQGSMYADLNGELNLNDIWLHGTNSGDKVTVSYIEISGGLC